MSLIDRIKKLRDDYVTRQVEGIAMPVFVPSPVRRKHLVFSGRVQGVGFRVEVWMLAGRLGLTGWVGNLPDGSVEAEIQGEEEKISFLIRYMKSLKRISIRSVDMEDVPPIPGDAEFFVKREYPYDGF